MMSLISYFLWSSVWTISDSLELQVIIHFLKRRQKLNITFLSNLNDHLLLSCWGEQLRFILSLNIAFLELNEKVYLVHLYCVARNSTKLLLPLWNKAKQSSFQNRVLMPSIILLSRKLISNALGSVSWNWLLGLKTEKYKLWLSKWKERV